MSNTLGQILSANRAFVSSFGSRGDLAPQPMRNVAILTCMDARIDTFAITGMDIGDMNVIRNAGGRASDDAIRSLLISSRFLGSTEWFIIQHTQCGMESVRDADIRKAFETHDQTGDEIDWLTIDNQPDTLLQDARRLREHPLVSEDIQVYALMYDVKTGELIDHSDEI